MGLTAEAVANDFKVSREDQDKFGFESHQKAFKAISEGKFKNEIVPITVKETFLDEKEKRVTRQEIVDTDEGPRGDTTLEKMLTLKPVFDAKGSVTAGNSSQTSDGAAFVLVVSERMLKQLNVKPIARLVDFAVAGVEPRIMGIGPVEAIPKVLKHSGMKLDDIQATIFGEAFGQKCFARAHRAGKQNAHRRFFAVALLDNIGDVFQIILRRFQAADRI